MNPVYRLVERQGRVFVRLVNRPEARNAVRCRLSAAVR